MIHVRSVKNNEIVFVAKRSEMDIKYFDSKVFVIFEKNNGPVHFLGSLLNFYVEIKY